ncbi:peptide MFS transporter [Erythrobacter sp. LQ02-29]|uniref:peptide MFS transporter n=1 Tax=Erythrobacter sp. LQ02-29 TaxID=2920384 RepID=UPI001F4EBAF9|nr:peptide MFS transporter [Erythrobacter sp. LQ02-29]MCP9221940.1 peptide MFS transporter [Erythrobacter sp. LQ02-29]
MKDMALWNEADWIAAIGSVALIVFLAIGAYAVLRKEPEFVGHPKGLFVLFFAEMWERFSYYGMRALLTLYLVKHWLYSDGQATIIYGAYTSLVYITPVLGGWLADRYLGQRKAVLFGAVLLTFGHFFMAFEGDAGAGYQNNPAINIFWLALAFIIVGSGFLKANISVIVGQLYPRTDIRRDGAYTIFYMGINVGAAIGTIIAGYLGETIGWSYGFGAAGVGMLLGLVVFVLGKPLLMGQGEPPVPSRLKEKVAGINREWFLYLTGFVGVAVIWALIQFQDAVGWILLASGALLLLYVLREAFKLDHHSRDRVFAMIFFILLMPVFWGLFEQAGGSVNLFTDRYVDRQGVPTSLFQSINPIYIILLGPVFAALWQWLGKRGWEPATPAKMGLGIMQMGLAFVVLVLGANAAGSALVPVLFIFLFYLLSTTGELSLSPVGLSAMNRLSVRHMASLMMAAFFFGTAGGNYVAGFLGSIMGEGEGGEITREGALGLYWTMGLTAIGIGAVVVLLNPLVKRLMHLDTLKDDDVGDDLEGQAGAGMENQEGGLHPTTRPQG